MFQKMLDHDVDVKKIIGDKNMMLQIKAVLYEKLQGAQMFQTMRSTVLSIKLI